jgi:hypothetical protein
MSSRLRVKHSDRRLLLGYGPAIVVAAGFLVMTLLVPSIAPEQDVSSAGQTTGVPAQGAAPSGVATTTTTSTATATSNSSTPQSIPVQAAGTPVAASGSVASCAGRQIPNDPYSPPCIAFSGNNGGATSHGVTASTITVSYRIAADQSSTIAAAIQQLAGKYNSTQFDDTQADITRTTDDLITYFNEHFQFYGRKLVLKQYQGTGELTEEVTDGGQSEADADALTAADTVGAFADITGYTQPYDEALSADHVINIGAPYMSAQWYEQHAPYAWSNYPDCTDLGNEGAQIAVKQLLTQNVTWAGTGVRDGGPRKIAVLAPDNPVYQQCAAQVTAALAKAGHPAVDNLTYTLDLSQLSQEASSIEQKIVNDGITTVICGCDPITLIYLTGDLDNAKYEPEWFNIGAAFTDEDLLAQLFDQNAWAQAAGVTNNGADPPYGSSPGYFAAKSVDPNFAPAHEVDVIYENLYILALGIDLAGPDLTPQTFEKGLFSYTGGDGQYGPWSFQENGVGTFTPQHQFRYEWWDPNATSTYDGEQGSYVSGTTWYTTSDIPSGPMPVFPNGPQ